MATSRFINGYMNREDIILLFRDAGTGALMKKVVGAEHIAYFKLADISADVKAAWDDDSRVISVTYEGSGAHVWARVKFRSGYWDSDRPNKWTGRKGMWVQYREEVCKEWEKRFKLQSYEADVSPLKRLVADRGYLVARPKRCYLDIETDSRVSFPQAKDGKARLLSWAVVAEDGRQWSGLLNADTDEDEIRLYREMWAVMEEFDQIVAWSGDGFDFPVIKARTKRLEREHEISIVKDVRRWLYVDHLLCFKRNNIMSAESGDEKQNFKLDTIATALLGEGKHDMDGSKTWEYWANGGTEREALLKYNIQDTDLLRRIEEKTGYLELFQTLAEVTNVYPDSKGLKPTHQVDGYMLRLGATKNVHFITKWYNDDDVAPEKFEGAFVMPPETDGIEADVHVADFAALYPSIMITWNLSPDTKLRVDPRKAASAFNVATECLNPETGTITDNTIEGILATALLDLMALRAEWNKKRAQCAPGTPEAKDAERRTNAYKTAANSFYGVMGTPYARYYDKAISESTTLGGQWLIKKTIAAATDRGWKVIYGDTDSLFVTGCSKEEFGAFVEWCNKSLYPELLAAMGCRINKISLAYEKQFSWVVFSGAKKYVGQFAHYKGKEAKSDSKPEIKGLEYKRGDANKIARRLQLEVIQDLCKGHHDAAEHEEILDSFKEYVMTANLPMEEVTVSKAITKDLEEYVTRKKMDGSDSATLPHVAVAQILLERGEDIGVGSRVAYVVTDAESEPTTVIPASDYKGECDRFYLWENLVYPPTMRLLQAAFPRHDWTRWEKVRPVKPRLKRSQIANPNQLGLFAGFEPATAETSVTFVEPSRLGTNDAPMVAPFRKREAS